MIFIRLRRRLQRVVNELDNFDLHLSVLHLHSSLFFAFTASWSTPVNFPINFSHSQPILWPVG